MAKTKFWLWCAITILAPPRLSWEMSSGKGIKDLTSKQMSSWCEHAGYNEDVNKLSRLTFAASRHLVNTKNLCVMSAVTSKQSVKHMETIKHERISQKNKAEQY